MPYHTQLGGARWRHQQFARWCLFQCNNLLGTFSRFQNYQKQQVYQYFVNAQHCHIFFFQHLMVLSFRLLQLPTFSKVLGLLFILTMFVMAWPCADILLLLRCHEQMLLNRFPCFCYRMWFKHTGVQLSWTPGFEEGWFGLFCGRAILCLAEFGSSDFSVRDRFTPGRHYIQASGWSLTSG